MYNNSSGSRGRGAGERVHGAPRSANRAENQEETEGNMRNSQGAQGAAEWSRDGRVSGTCRQLGGRSVSRMQSGCITCVTSQAMPHGDAMTGCVTTRHRTRHALTSDTTLTYGAA